MHPQPQTIRHTENDLSALLPRYISSLRPIIYTLLLFVSVWQTKAQECCPVRNQLGTRDHYEFNTNGDNITSQIKRDTDEDWATITNYNASQYKNEHDYFLYITATSSRSAVNSDDRLVLCWWLGTDTSGKTQDYAGTTGPPVGTYYLQEQHIYEFGPYYYGYSYDYFYYWGWMYGNVPSSPALMQYQRFEGYTNSGYVNWVSPFSSYVHPRNNSYDYVSFNTYRVEVSVGDNGKLFIAIFQPNQCNPMMTIGSKTNDVYALTTSSVGNGTVTVSCDCDYHETGEQITLTPVPANKDVCFKKWTGADANAVKDNGDGTYTLTMQAKDMEVVANFGSCALEYTDTICDGDTYNALNISQNHPDIPYMDAAYFTYKEQPYDNNKPGDIRGMYTGDIYDDNNEAMPCTVYVFVAKAYAFQESLTYCYPADAAQLTSFWSKHTLTDPATGNPISVPTGITAATSLQVQEKFTSRYHCDSIYTYDINICFGGRTFDTLYICSANNFSYTWDKESNPQQKTKTSADIRHYTFDGKDYPIVDSLKASGSSCGTSCEYVNYLVVLEQTKPIDKEETTVVGASALDGIEAGWNYTFDAGTKEAHILTITDTTGVPRTGSTYHYYETLKSTGGCDSVLYTLNLRVVRPVTMEPETIRVCSNSMEANAWIIEGWDEHNDNPDYQAISEEGIYHDTRKTADGTCDSIYYTMVYIEDQAYAQYNVPAFPAFIPVDYRIKDTIYASVGQTVKWGDKTYTSDKVDIIEDVANDKTIHGCDSISLLTLYFIESKGYMDATICEGDAYPWRKFDNTGDTLCFTSKEYPYHLKNYMGIDSTAVLRLTVLPTAKDSTYTRSIVEGDTYSDAYFSGLTTAQTYTVGRPYYGQSCDSVRYVLTLETVQTVDMPLEYAHRCSNEGAYEWHIKDWTEHNLRFDHVLDEGLYHDTIFSVSGMDSIRYSLQMNVYQAFTLQNGVEREDDIDTRVRIEKYINAGEGYFFDGEYKYDEGEYIEFGKTVATNCDSVTILTLHVNNETVDELTKCASELPFLWNGINITSEEQGNGQKVTLVSQQTSRDSVVTLSLTVLPSYDGIIDGAVICYNELADFTWEGETFTDLITENTGEVQFVGRTKTLESSLGCDSTVTFSLTVYPTYDGIEDGAAICYNELADFTWEGETFTDLITKNTGSVQTASRTKTLDSSLGCDSTVTFTLTVYPTYTQALTQTVCESELPVTLGGEVFDKAETRVLNLQSVNGCDSIVTLTLNVTPVYNSITDGAVICYDELPTFRWEGFAFTDLVTTNTGKTQTVSRTENIGTKDGCDSIVTFTLTVHPTYAVTDSRTICESELPYRWEGEVYNNDVTAFKTLKTVNGCDSVVAFILTVIRPTQRNISDEVCDNQLPYRWFTYHEQYINEAGTYVDVQKSKEGCDSIIHILTLTVYTQPVTGTAAVLNQTICPDTENLMIDFAFTDGSPSTYDLIFDDFAKEQGFTDVTGTVTYGRETRITMPIPNDATLLNSYPQADNYHATLVVTDRCEKTQSYPIDFTLLYPASLIVQKWNDVLAVYNEKANGGQVFSSIQWYRNGIALEGKGDMHSYIYELPNLAFGEPYWVELTRANDGKRFRTCAFYPQRKGDNPQNSSERVRLTPRIPGNYRQLLIQTDITGDYRVYDITGKQLMQGKFDNEKNNVIEFNSYYTNGTYIIRFHGEDGTTEVKKWLVQ